MLALFAGATPGIGVRGVAAALRVIIWLLRRSRRLQLVQEALHLRRAVSEARVSSKKNKETISNKC